LLVYWGNMDANLERDPSVLLFLNTEGPPPS
jgi:hypothetical protein